MGEPHVISALKDKRAELSGVIRSLEAKIGQHRADLQHLDATLRLFAPEIEPEAILAKRPVTRNDWFKHGECARLVCDVLRDAPTPVPTAEIVRQVMEMKGIPAGDGRTRALMLKTVRGSLNRADGIVEKVEIGGLTCWQVAEKAA